MKNLAPYDLTKAEKLQIVNLAPTLPVELYVVCVMYSSGVKFLIRSLYKIVEELEDRFGHRMEEILAHVQTTTAPSVPGVTTVNEQTDFSERIIYEENQDWASGYEDAEAIADDGDFDDTGEGVGVEGDLDMEDG